MLGEMMKSGADGCPGSYDTRWSIYAEMGELGIHPAFFDIRDMDTRMAILSIT